MSFEKPTAAGTQQRKPFLARPLHPKGDFDMITRCHRLASLAVAALFILAGLMGVARADDGGDPTDPLQSPYIYLTQDQYNQNLSNGVAMHLYTTVEDPDTGQTLYVVQLDNPPPGPVDPPPAATDFLAGSWTNVVDGLGTSTWTFTPRGDGTYDAQEAGLGNAHGTATLTAFNGAGHVHIDFTYSGGSGTYDMDTDTSGTGLFGTTGNGMGNYTCHWSR
jgi:hypothetical protein